MTLLKMKSDNTAEVYERKDGSLVATGAEVEVLLIDDAPVGLFLAARLNDFNVYIPRVESAND